MRGGGLGAWLLLVTLATAEVPPLAPQDFRTTDGAVPALVPYVDPTQQTVPWPKHSHSKHPIRSWSEVIPATVLLSGIGVVTSVWYLPRANPGVNFRLLHEAGISRIRVELVWGALQPGTQRLAPSEETRFLALMQAAKANDLRPLILLNAHHGTPTPRTEFTRVVTVAAPAGSRTVTLNDVSNLVPGFSGFSDLTDYWEAEAIITAVNVTTRQVTLSKPLPVSFAANTTRSMATLSYRPLFPVGTAEFDHTASGWLTYAREVCRLMRAASVPAFDLEIWNELTFGTRFLDINNYYTPAIAATEPNGGLNGLPTPGRLWELGRRTVDMLRAECPEATAVWGFSNTTYFNPTPGGLPAGTPAMSFHPYERIWYRSLADEPGGMAQNLEGYAPPAPPYSALLPEAVMTFLRPESLTLYLHPAQRPKPPGVTDFAFVATEHGLCPRDFGVTGVGPAQTMQAKTLLRSAVTFLHAGMRAVWFYVDLAGGGFDPECFDLVPSTVLTQATWPADPNPLYTPATRAIQRLTQAAAGAVPIPSPRALTLSVHLDGGQIFPGDATHPPLTYRDLLTVQPFQVTPTRFLVTAYVMSRDITKPFPESLATVALDGIVGTGATVSATDSLTGAVVPVEVLDRSASRVVLRLPVSDTPRLVLIQES